MQEKATTQRSLTPLWIMLAIFAAPVIAAWFFYFNPEYLPEGRANRGELIPSTLLLAPDETFLTPGGTPFDGAPLKDKWTLVWLEAGPCGETCRRHLVDLRQIRLALGEGQMNVERLLLLTDPASGGNSADLARDFPGLLIALTETFQGERLLRRLGGLSAQGRLYILDPMGQLMMRYAPDVLAKDPLKDMGRLVKASKNWIKGTAYEH
ncbi:MAG: hypothetical protein WCP34_08815 [Pseudomonadota bacterium]